MLDRNDNDIEEVCDTCGGTGEVERTTTECNDSTGYNPITEGTGEFIPCPDCSGEEDEDYQFDGYENEE